ncbi:hypothetical protein N0V93_007018 [Gnomoniopsis smithogilvyi]|uniref:Cyclin-like domain-containing protein n=1 Tax=Gnomoniopsis smithogilvyi TaxID=1191159 RepID=A0A9W8YST7_9PEZI|nr:hypothetical protein N0V93_007018 [Gnomoniopsis smithogilvyi]
MATEDDRYRTSSQFREWSFTPAQLADTRSKTNSLAKKAISERLSSTSSSTSASANPSGANTPIPVVSTATAPADVPNDLLSTASASAGAAAAGAAAGAAPSSSLPEFLTPAEEEQLLRYYTVETLRAAEFCGLPTEIRATAAIFLRRFYLTHSVMTYPPTKMLKTCVFFGAKAENYYPRVKTIADKFPKTTGEEILAGEFLLCQGIRFAFDVRHPFRALEGAVMQLRSFGDLDETKIEKAHKRTRTILKFSPIVTDAYFHYTPSQIMLAALSIADPDLAERLIEATFSGLPPGASGPDAANGKHTAQEMERIIGLHIKKKTVETVQACKDMLLQEPVERFEGFWTTPEANNQFKPLTKKLRKCRDPDRFDLIALHKKRLEFREKEAGGAGGRAVADDDIFGGAGADQAKSNADREAKRRKVAAEDPFGPAL